MTEKRTPTFWATIFVAGDYHDAARACREFCMTVGLCVTIERCAYVYTGGAEDGVRVGMVNYPRFPASPDNMKATAVSLAIVLRAALSQHSVLIQFPDETLWLSSRNDEASPPIIGSVTQP